MPRSLPLLTKSQIASQATIAEPIQSGIYFLLQSGAIVYVGKSVYVLARICSHMTGPKKFDAWAWVPCPVDDLAALERAYIDAFMPPYNCDGATMKLRGGWTVRRDIDFADLSILGVAPDVREECLAEMTAALSDPEVVTEDMMWRERMRRLREIKADRLAHLQALGAALRKG